MDIYIAHNMEARDWLRSDVVPVLQAAGHTVTSQWILEDPYSLPRSENAEQDLADIDRADILLMFIDPFADKPGKGKWVEWGYAMGSGCKAMLIGSDSSCVFCHHPSVIRATDINSAIDLLAYLEQRQGR